MPGVRLGQIIIIIIIIIRPLKDTHLKEDPVSAFHGICDHPLGHRPLALTKGDGLDPRVKIPVSM